MTEAWICDICGEAYKDKSECQACEAKGTGKIPIGTMVACDDQFYLIVGYASHKHYNVVQGYPSDPNRWKPHLYNRQYLKASHFIKYDYSFWLYMRNIFVSAGYEVRGYWDAADKDIVLKDMPRYTYGVWDVVSKKWTKDLGIKTAPYFRTTRCGIFVPI